MIVPVKYTSEMDLTYQALSWWFNLPEDESALIREKYYNEVWNTSFIVQIYTEKVLNNS